jgi:DNA-binding transcriptional regulator YhcF (GntR family)
MSENDSKQFEIRDLRKKDKFFIDDLYLDGYAKKCGIYATGVYLSLCRHVNKQQQCYPSFKKMAEELHISTKQVGRSITALENLNIIKRLRMGKKLNNRYVLLDKSEWTNSPITKDYQSDHIETISPFHSKDTHIKDTHNKESFPNKNNNLSRTSEEKTKHDKMMQDVREKEFELSRKMKWD